MKKVAIIRCLDVSMRCVGASCMKSFNSHTVKFERYGDEELELFAGLTCNGCGQTVENDEGLKKNWTAWRRNRWMWFTSAAVPTKRIKIIRS